MNILLIIIRNCYWQLCNKFCNHFSTLILLINRRVTSPRPRKESPETERNSSADYFRRRCVDGTGCWIKSVKRNLREFFFRLAWRTREGRQREEKLVGESATFARRSWPQLVSHPPRNVPPRCARFKGSGWRIGFPSSGNELRACTYDLSTREYSSFHVSSFEWRVSSEEASQIELSNFYRWMMNVF